MMIRPSKSGKHRSDHWPRWPECLSPLGGFAWGAQEYVVVLL